MTTVDERLAEIRGRVSAAGAITVVGGHRSGITLRMEAQIDRARLLAAVDAVLALHVPLDYCEHRDHIHPLPSLTYDCIPLCAGCGGFHDSCPTVRAVTEALGETE